MTPSTLSDMSDLTLRGFNVYEISGAVNPFQAPGRRDFYKIVLTAGHRTIRYGNQTIETNDTFLFFANPTVAHSVVHRTEQKGYKCLFTDAFMVGKIRTDILQNSPLFRVDGTPIISLNPEQAVFMTGLYQKMLSVQRSDYAYRDEWLSSCVALIIHEALSYQPAQDGLTLKMQQRGSPIYLWTYWKGNFQ